MLMRRKLGLWSHGPVLSRSSRFYTILTLNRGVALVVQWITTFWHIDFSTEASKKSLASFVSSISRSSENNSEFRLLQRVVYQLVKSKELEKAPEDKPATPSLENMEMLNITTHDVLNYESDDIAKALTTQDVSRISAINPMEFLLFIWGETGPKVANVSEMILNFNVIGWWVPTEICRQPDLKTRVKLIEKFIKIAKVFPCVNTTLALSYPKELQHSNGALLRLKLLRSLPLKSNLVPSRLEKDQVPPRPRVDLFPNPQFQKLSGGPGGRR
jgi:hypothetical protein